MTSLTKEEWKELDSMILKIHSIGSVVEFQYFILHDLAAFLGASFASWNEHGRQLYLEKVINSSDYESRVAPLVPALNATLPTHPSFGHFVDFMTGKVRLVDTVERTREIDTERRYHDTEFYKQVASKLGVEDQLLMHIYVKNESGVILTFHGVREFTPAEHLKACVIRGHILARLYELSKKPHIREECTKQIKGDLEEVLTEKELQILRWVCTGKSNKEIAVVASSSKRTVDKHVSHILKKLEMSSRNKVIATYSNWLAIPQPIEE